MSLILLVSIVIRVAALGWALLAWRRLRDWRIGFLSLMLLLMAVRQSWTLKRHTQSWYPPTWGGLDELPGLLVSVLALLAVVFLERMLMESRRKAEEERLFSAILRFSLEDAPDFLDRVLRLLVGFPHVSLQKRAAVWLRQPGRSDYTLVASLGSDDFQGHVFPRCPLSGQCGDGGNEARWKHRVDEQGEPVIELCLRADRSCCGWLVLYLQPGFHLRPEDYRLLEQVAILIGLSLARQQARRQLQYQARHDALTGLCNRYAFQERLTTALDEAGQGGHWVLCYFDLDQFKVVNDTCGHAAGDELLRQVAEILRSNLNPGDCAARLGGDEFALLCRGELNRALERVRQLLAQLNQWRFLWQGKVFQVRASFGVVALEPAFGDWETVLGYADTACFMAKEYGRNRIQVYRSDDQALRQRCQEMNWVSRVETALEQGHFRLYAQPIVPLGNKDDVPHYEILLRLCDPAGGLIPPAQFLPAAERYHLMIRIDRWVVKEALALLSRFPGHRECYSINLSGQSLGDRELLAIIRQGCRQVAPERLCFEITETAAICNLPRARPFLEALRQLGCRLALDDFGTGLSSYAYLRRLPVDLLKIDGQFVRDICQDPVALAMIRSINEVTHILGKRTVAEWVENRSILEQLRELAVDYVQGYHLGEPVPLEQILQQRRQAL